MKTYLSLSLKLTLIVVAVSASVIFSLTLYNINDQSISFENIYVDKAKDTAAALEIFRNETITNTSFPAAINSIQEQNNDSIEYIHFFEKKQDNIILAHSTNSSEYNGNHDEYVLLSMNESKIVKITSPNTKKITVIAPGFSSTNQSFAYEFSYLTTDAYQILQQRSTNLFLISAASLFVLIFSVLFLLRHTIVKPIIQFRDAAKTFGKGNLQTRIPLSSNDELGELADAFNTMAEDLEQSRETLEEYNKILERLIDQKDAFIGQLGHDLKNPLQPLIGLLPILIQQEKDPKMKEHLKVMNENAQYMKELIFKTLELAKLRTEKISFEFDKMPLSETVDRVITTQKPMLEKNNISISNLIPKDISVYADALRLKEVFKNLITNAVKYTPDSGGKISISAKEKKDYVQVSITDTGIGMSEEQIKKIFDEFYRADSSAHGQDSVGLGLSITKRIIEKHNGKIWAESNGKDKGSTFHFTLPKKGEKNQ